MHHMQRRNSVIALTGNSSFDVNTWLARLMISANEIADQIMIDSAEDNALRATYTGFDEKFGAPIPQAELMSSHYGSFGQKLTGMSPRTSQCAPYAKRYNHQALKRHEGTIPGSAATSELPERSSSDDDLPPRPPKTPSSEQLLVRIFTLFDFDETVHC